MKRDIRKFIIEVTIIFVCVICAIIISDSRHVFNQEENNNHTGRRWNALYQMKGQNNATDILVLGNSHSYCGLLPEVVEENTGRTCFILASLGVCVTDAYYMLEEALTLVKPKILVLETYLLQDYETKKLVEDNLNCQFQSFENRRNISLKTKSTFKLFTLDNAPYAWSKTLRNHSYIFENMELVKYNLKHPKPKRSIEKDYKGRFIRFTTGLTEAVLTRYENEGAPFNGQEYLVGEEAREYCEKIKELCNNNDIELVFLTIPVYNKHISHVEEYHNNLSEAVGSYPWLDLQLPYFNQAFDTDCFEDSYLYNQHMTSKGAYISSVLLSQFLNKITQELAN